MTRALVRVLAMVCVAFAVLCGFEQRWVDVAVLIGIAFVFEIFAEDDK